VVLILRFAELLIMKTWIQKHELISFFVLSYAIMYVVLFGYILIQPGKPMVAWSLVWFLSIFSPTYSAVIVSLIIGGLPELKRLLTGFTRWKVGWMWYFAAAFLFLGPFIIALVYIALGHPAEGLQAGWTIPLLLGKVFTQLIAGPVSEEAGWRGFALPRLQMKHNALVSSLILGVIWTFWHLPLFFLTGETQVGIPFPIYLVLVTSVTVYLTWLYNNTHGSLIITTLGHFSFNLTGTLITGIVTLMPLMIFYLTAGPMLFLVVIAVIIVFGPKYLSKKPVSELPIFEDETVGNVNLARI
jgi:membrane protease YdiL (CAAX protease family)